MTSLGAAHTTDQLVPTVGRIAEASGAGMVLCATDDAALAIELQERTDLAVVAATHDVAARDELERAGITVVTVRTQVADKYRQARLAAGSALAAGAAEEGQLVVCVVGHGTSLGGGDLVVVTRLDDTSRIEGISDLVSLTDGVSPTVFEALLEIASRIGQVASRGKRLGALFVIGDSGRVQDGARQLVLNPLSGHAEDERRITNPAIHDTLVELAKLDGAFVLRGDGLILTCGVYLASADTEVVVPSGLGARHVTAAAVTGRTRAAAVVVSATDGAVRVFSGGRMVLRHQPDHPFG